MIEVQTNLQYREDQQETEMLDCEMLKISALYYLPAIVKQKEREKEKKCPRSTLDFCKIWNVDLPSWDQELSRRRVRGGRSRPSHIGANSQLMPVVEKWRELSSQVPQLVNLTGSRPFQIGTNSHLCLMALLVFATMGPLWTLNYISLHKIWCTQQSTCLASLMRYFLEEKCF